MKRNYLILFVVLTLLLAACNQGSGEEDSVVEIPTLAATAVPIEGASSDSGAAASGAAVAADSSDPAAEEIEEAAPGEPGEDSDGGDSDEGPTPVNLDDFLLYDEPPDMNYRTTLEFYMLVANADGSTDQSGRVYAEGARTVTPDASTMVFNMEGSAGGGLGGETMTIAQIEDAFYYSVPPNDCVSIAGQSGFENPFDLFLDTGGFLSGDVQRVLPNQNINGVNSRHYKIDPENLVSLAVYEVYEADLYVAEDGGYVTRLFINGFGVDEVLSGNSAQNGEIYYELNFIPADDIPAIVPPEGCGQVNAIAAEYPTLPDAVGIISMEGVYSYETQTPFDDVIEFYKTELTKDNEWGVTQEIIQAPNATITFTGVDGTLMVNLGPGQAGGVQVGIILIP